MRNNFRFLSVLFFLTIAFNNAFAQDITGLNTDNYAGVHMLSYNPAEIVDSRYKWHINLASTSLTASNNYVGIESKDIIDAESIFNNTSKKLTEILSVRVGEQREAITSGEVNFFPSFIYSYGGENYRRAQSIGFSAKTRYQASISGIPKDLSEILLGGDFYSSKADIFIENFRFQMSVWNEYGITYGASTIDDENSFLAIAFTAKVIQGYASAYFMSTDGIQTNLTGLGEFSLKSNRVDFGYSEKFNKGILDANILDLFKSTNIGFGLDFGAVWEYRPNKEKFRYPLDKDDNYIDPTKEKYKLKIGLSVMDLGYVPFKTLKGNNSTYTINSGSIDIDTALAPVINGINAGGNLRGLDNELTVLGTKTPKDTDSFIAYLPMKLNTYVDYNIFRGFYANASVTLARDFQRESTVMRDLEMRASITPRYERKWFSMYVPVSYTSHKNLSVGVGLRLGVLHLGVGDFLGIAGVNPIRSQSVYAGLTIPIFKKLKDKDMDHVSDDKDKCPEKPGNLLSKGCPDSDGDGVPDDKDRCIDEPGDPKLGGCPDTDNDNIPDIIDKCPDIAGVKKYKGCPNPDEKEEIEKDTMPVIDTTQVAKKVLDTLPLPNKPKKSSKRFVTKTQKQLEKDLTTGFVFNPGSVIISNKSYAMIDEVAEYMKENPNQDLYLSGHTDNQGTPEGNIELSEGRLILIRSSLVIKGIDPNKIKMKAYGETKPIASNKTAAGRRKNRRVEFEFKESER